MVTGPSFISSTFISAPNSPVPISLPNAKLSSRQNCSYSGTDISRVLPYVGGTVAFLGGGVEGELADNQYLAVCFKNGFVHYAVFVIENAPG